MRLVDDHRWFWCLAALGSGFLSLNLAYAERLQREPPATNEQEIHDTVPEVEHLPGEGPVSAWSISGGVSLGAYQAGYLYYETAFLRANPGLHRPLILTGTSAGAINAVLSLVEQCSPQWGGPEESLWWQTWSQLGFKRLVGKHDSANGDLPGESSVALFSGQLFVELAKIVEARFNQGLPTSCQVALGIPTTLVEPQTLLVSQGLSVQRQNVRFILRVRGRGAGKIPLIENYVDHSAGVSQPRLYFDPDPAKRFATLRDLVKASASFPAAFPAQPLRVCFTTDPHRPESECSLEQSVSADFVDGGFLDNQPLRLALRIAKQSVVGRAGHYHLTERPRATGRDHSRELYIRHVDASAHDYPEESAGDGDEAQNKSPSFLPYLLHLTAGMVNTVRSRELYAVLEESPWLRAQIQSSLTHYPRASDPWASFFGFFDRGFREFDFLLGMVDARRNLRDSRSAQIAHYRFPFEEQASDPQLTASAGRFQCLAYYLNDPPQAFATARAAVPCDQMPQLRNLRALTQVMFNRLAQRTRKTPRFVEERFAQIAWKKDAGEEDGLYSLRLLETYGYEFDPQEFPPDKGHPRDYLRLKLEGALHRLASRQPLGEGGAVRTLGEIALNYYDYLPPRAVLYFGLGESTEVLYANRTLGILDLPRPLKWAVALQSFRISDLFKHEADQFSLTPLGGVEVDALSFVHGLVQLRGALRAGYLFASSDGYGRRPCRDPGAHYTDACSGWALQPAVSLSVLNRFRLQIPYRIALGQPGRKAVGEFNVQVGFQFVY